MLKKIVIESGLVWKAKELSEAEDKETSFVNYKIIKDTDGNNGDLNGGDGKQWLAIYYTKNSDAGNPLIAPVNEEEKDTMKVQMGTDKVEACFLVKEKRKHRK